MDQVLDYQFLLIFPQILRQVLPSTPCFTGNKGLEKEAKEGNHRSSRDVGGKIWARNSDLSAAVDAHVKRGRGELPRCAWIDTPLFLPHNTDTLDEYSL